MGDKFNEKKRGLETSSEEFAENLKKVCDEKVVVEPTKYEEMVEEWRVSNILFRFRISRIVVS